MEQLRPTTSPNSTNNNIQPSNVTEVDITKLVMGGDTGPRQPDTKTREFSVDDMKEQPSTIKIDIFGGDKPNDFIKNPTEFAKTIAPTSAPAYINPGVGSSTSPMAGMQPVRSKEEIAGNIKTMIAIIDYILSMLGLILSGKGTQTIYTADATQKKLLETALVDYMYEKKMYMSPGWALFLASLGAYGFMLLGALKDRYELMMAKRKNKINQAQSNAATDTVEVKQTPSYSQRPVASKPEMSREEMKHYQDIKPITVPPPLPQVLRTETVYKEVNGVLEPQQMAMQSATTSFKSSWNNPDPNIVARDREDLFKYLAAGIFPMFKKNQGDNKNRIVKYHPDGRPKLIGRVERKSKSIK